MGELVQDPANAGGEVLGRYKSYLGALVPPGTPLSVHVVKGTHPPLTRPGDAGYEVELPDGDPFSAARWVWATREALRIRHGLVFSDSTWAAVAGSPPCRDFPVAREDALVAFTVLGNLVLDLVITRDFPGVPYAEYARANLSLPPGTSDLPSPDQVTPVAHSLYRWAWGALLNATGWRKGREDAPRAPGVSLPAGLERERRPLLDVLEGAVELAHPSSVEDPRLVGRLCGLAGRLLSILRSRSALPLFVVDPKHQTRIQPGGDREGDLVGVGGPPGNVRVDSRQSAGGKKAGAPGGGVRIGQGGRVSRQQSSRRGNPILGYVDSPGTTPRPGSSRHVRVVEFRRVEEVLSYSNATRESASRFYEATREAFAHFVEAARERLILHRQRLANKRNQSTGRLVTGDAISMLAEHRLGRPSSRLPFSSRRLDPGAAVLLILDLSGSMRGIPLRLARYFATLLAEILEDTPVSLCVVGSGAKPGKPEVSEVLFKGFDERVRPEKLGAIECNWRYCENRDPTVLDRAPEHFKHYHGPDFSGGSVHDRVVVLVNDELPNHMEVTGDAGRVATLEALGRLRSLGYRVYNVSFHAKSIATFREWFGEQHFLRVDPYALDDVASDPIDLDPYFGYKEKHLEALSPLGKMVEFALRILSE
ncbi:MAG: hypothetical protein Kow0069_29360 [Promethearchaeota archaeon]